MSARQRLVALAVLLMTLLASMPGGLEARSGVRSVPGHRTPRDVRRQTSFITPDPTPPAALPGGLGRPDIVLLLIDDLAQMDDRLWQRLPTIKRLFLDSGVRFTDYIGNDPLCCPGRANLLTGQWAEHHGVIENDARLLDPRETIATELRSSGYWTGIFGKYFNRTPLLRDKWPPGWNQAFIFAGNYWNYTAWANGDPVVYRDKESDYSTTVVQGRVLSALAAAPADQPRFVWLAPFATHAGNDPEGIKSFQPQPAPADVGAPVCADTPPWSTPANLELDLSDKPAYLRHLPLVPDRPMVRTCEALLSVERMLAAVLASFVAQGRPEPMIILTADNGMAWGAHHWRNKHVPYAAPIPLFIHWPAVLGDAPVTVPTTVTNVDIAPTLCAIAGCVMGPYFNRHGVDGLDLTPLLLAVGDANRGAQPAAVRTLPSGVARTADGLITGLRLGREVVFTEHLSRQGTMGMPPWRGLRTTDESPIGRWVWNAYVTGERELYDDSGGPCWTWAVGHPGDPCQLTNLASDPTFAPIRAILSATLAGRERSPLRLASPRVSPSAAPTVSPPP